MRLRHLLVRNLIYHWRGNLAILVGVAVGTSVLTGALFVGDSLRGSLRDLTLDRLRWVEHALVAGRFLRQDVAEPIGADQIARRVAPAAVLQGAAKTARGGEPVRRVTILGVDDHFWLDGQAPVEASFWQQEDRGGLDQREVVLNADLARELNAGAGDMVAFHLRRVSAIPRE